MQVCTVLDAANIYIYISICVLMGVWLIAHFSFFYAITIPALALTFSFTDAIKYIFILVYTIYVYEYFCMKINIAYHGFDTHLLLVCTFT